MSCGEFPDKPLCHFHLLEWMRRLCASLRFSSRSFPHLLATNYSTAQLRLLDIVHADQKLYLVFEFLDVDLKRYIETGNQNGKPITAPIVKVSPNSMRFGLSPFLPVWPGFVPVIARRVLSRLFIRILSSLRDTSSLFHFVHLGRAFARGRDAYMTGTQLSFCLKTKTGECMRPPRMPIQFLIISIFVSFKCGVFIT